jgi:CTP synthase (UTP-ammonia lyase)
MPAPIRIGLVGDPSSAVRAHAAIPSALADTGARLATAIQWDWLPTSTIGDRAEELLAGFDGIWCVPGSPYADMDGALAAIRYARTAPRPFLGTCGGYQHALIEYARSVLGMANADHAESNPGAATPLITPLECTLIGRSGPIEVRAGSLAAESYGAAPREERYHCGYGLGARYRALFEQGDLRITGWDDAGEPRVVELAGHPFFLATLFQPELSSTAASPHPMIVAFVRAAGVLARRRPTPPSSLAGAAGGGG